MKLLEAISVPYAVSNYAHSVYGDSAQQRALIDNLLRHCKPMYRHHFSVRDDFLCIETLASRLPHVARTLYNPETPSSIFEVLPIMLTYGYRYLCMGHERGADTGNFFSSELGKEVNHQWGKSFEAETLINDYIQKCLLRDFHYFSILKPVYDFLIFQKLKDYKTCIRDTQSCNVDKPWCKRCAKCVYIWLCTLAYLDINLFNENLFQQLEAVATCCRCVLSCPI